MIENEIMLEENLATFSEIEKSSLAVSRSNLLAAAL